MKWPGVVMWSIIYGLIIPRESQAKIVKKRGVMDNFNGGLKVAGQMFGINTAADVANLVAKAFSNTNNNRNKGAADAFFSLIQNGLKVSPTSPNSSENGQQQETHQKPEYGTKASAGGINFDTPNLIANMLRMVGFDASKLGALAINALIMLASAIGNAIMGTAKPQHKLNTPEDGRLFSEQKKNENVAEENADTGPEEKYSPNEHQPRAMSDDVTTIDWFLRNSPNKIKHILKEAIHTDLTDKLIDMITTYESEQDQAPCLKMLVCKSSPFIWGMQKSIRKHIEPKKNDDVVNTDDNEKAEQNLLNVKSFFTHLPALDEYRKHGEECEKLYSITCNITDLYDKTY